MRNKEHHRLKDEEAEVNIIKVYLRGVPVLGDVNPGRCRTL